MGGGGKDGEGVGEKEIEEKLLSISRLRATDEPEPHPTGDRSNLTKCEMQKCSFIAITAKRFIC